MSTNSDMNYWEVIKRTFLVFVFPILVVKTEEKKAYIIFIFSQYPLHIPSITDIL